MNPLFRINLAEWIIGDGNHPDFTVGDVGRFAVNFWPHAKLAREKSGREIACTLEGENAYEVCATTVFCSRRWWVIDFGIQAYLYDQTPSWARRGQRCAGCVSLWVDPFYYQEGLFWVRGAPPLVYSWRIERIQEELPASEESGGKSAWRDVHCTDAISGGVCLMDCRRLSDNPMRE